MLKLQNSLSQIPLLKNIFEFAETLPDNIPPPWDNEYTEGQILLGDVPPALQKILVANFRLGFDVHDKIKRHVDNHPECFDNCSIIQEFIKEIQDHRVISSFIQYLIMRHIDNFNTPWIILKDWRIVIPTLTSSIENMFTLQFMSPPTAEEKEHGS